MRLLPLPAFADNYIWTLSDDHGRSLVVDPGEAAPVIAAAAQGLLPVAILLTHHHADHTGGVYALLERWPQLPVFAPRESRIGVATRRIDDGERIELGDWRFEVLAGPGHTVSHIAVHGHGLLFCGDTLFSLGCGRMFEGTPMQMLASLDRLAALPATSKVCCGHEYTVANAAFARMVDPDNPALRRRTKDATAMRQAGRPTLPSLLADECAANPFLRIDTPAIRAAVAAHIGHAPADRVETFAELRRWKDGFRG
ncbi:MAG: hydroxyacylglutathione hydrolase [Gammaproteobacteria bacterium]|nr:hydroxyacylglutathione hydrolase [Gammaproteobacteria bacterium]